MANTQLIDEIVDPAAKKQVSDLTALLSSLDIELVQNTKDATALNAALLLNSKTYSTLNKAANDAALANEKLAQAQIKTATASTAKEKADKALEAQVARTQLANDRATASTLRLQQQQEKAAASAQKALSPYQQLSKQLDTIRASAKDVGVVFGENSAQFIAASKPVQELDARLKSIDKTLGQSQRNVGNYKDAFSGLLGQFLPFGQQAGQVVDGLKNIAGASEGGSAALGELGGAFLGVTTTVFVASVAAATYYLSLFRSTGNTVRETLGGLKQSFAAYGESLIHPAASDKQGASLVDQFKAGKQAETDVVGLENLSEVKTAQNGILQAQSEYFRALSNDRTKDIKDRQAYLKEAQDLQNKVLANQQAVAAATIATAFKVGFQLSTLTKDQQQKQKDLLISAAAQGNLQPAQTLSQTGQQFSSQGFDLYKQGVQLEIEYRKQAENQIVQLAADRNNQELRADKALAAAQNELDKARIQGQLDGSKLILDDVRSSNTQKLAANRNFISQSIALIKNEEANQLETAGLGAGRSGKDSRTEALQRQAITQDTQNKINSILAQGMKTRQDLQKNAFDAQSRLDKATISEIQERDRQVLESETSSYQQRINAQADFVNQSLKQINKDEADQLRAANLPKNPVNDDPTQAKTRFAIQKENQTKRIQVAQDGDKQLDDIQKRSAKDLTDILKQSVDDQLQFLQTGLDDQLSLIEDSKLNQSKELIDLRNKNLLTEKDYSDQVKLLNDATNGEKIDAELKTAQTILGIKEALALGGLGSIKDVTAAQKTVSGLKGQQKQNKVQTGQDNAQTDTDKAQEQKEKVAKDTALAAKDAGQIQDEASKLIQQEYQHEIDLLEQKRKIIDDNAQAEIDGVNNSILSEKDKQNKINIINKQQAIANQQITAQENQIKHKQAVADKEANIAKIIENTAVAVTAQLAIPFAGIGLAILVGALGAAELALAIAQPIPSYADGVKSHPGGFALWGEAGIEAAKLPGGRVKFSNGPTVENLPTGTRVYSNAELMSMNAPRSSNYTGATEIGWREVVAAIDRQKHPEQKRPYVNVNVSIDRSGYLRR